ncbi:MAG: YdgA family protein [Gammaproteobacteria bacterium]|nr:YdgA family protein [Gammaproteobacteria bacterium]
MKKIRLLIVIVLFIAALSPFLLGFEIENRYRGILAEFEAAGYQLTSHEYERGFFDSRAESVLSLPINAPNTDIKDISITIESQFLLGPYSLHGWTGDLSRITSIFLYDGKPVFPEDMQAEIITTIGFSGDGNTEIDLPKMSDPAELDKDLFMDFFGLSGDINFNLVKGKITLNLAGDGLRVYSPGSGRLEVGKLELVSESVRGINDLMLGGGDMSVEYFRVMDESSQFSVELNNLGLSASSSVEGGNVNMAASYHFDQLLAADERFGPAELEMEIVSISAEVMARFQESVREMQQQQLPPQQQGLAMMGVMMSALPAFLEQNPGFRINKFELLTPQGQVSATFSLAAEDMKVTDVSAAPLLIQKLVGDASIRAPEPLVKQMLMAISLQQAMNALQNSENAEEVDMAALQSNIEQLTTEQIETVIRQGFVERKGNMLLSKASLKAGLLSVNGKMIPLPEMQ